MGRCVGAGMGDEYVNLRDAAKRCDFRASWRWCAPPVCNFSRDSSRKTDHTVLAAITKKTSSADAPCSGYRSAVASCHQAHVRGRQGEGHDEKEDYYRIHPRPRLPHGSRLREWRRILRSV